MTGSALKSAEAAQLVDAVRRVAAGDGVLEPSVTGRLMAAFAAAQPQRRPDPTGLDRLTDRERDVLACLGAGLSNQQIARRLLIGETTVKTHVSGFWPSWTCGRGCRRQSSPRRSGSLSTERRVAAMRGITWT